MKIVNALAMAGVATLAATTMAAATMATTTTAADSAKLKLLATGAMQKMGGYMPQRLELSATKPDSVKKMPSDVTAPLFGVLKMGAKDNPTSFVIVVDEPEGKDSRLFVDTNANGDLTDDPAPQWTKRPYKAGETSYTQYMGGGSVQLKFGDEATPLHLGMYRFDKNDANRAALKNILLYYADYGFEGDVELGGKSYKAMLVDRMATGDFRGKTGVSFMIDVNANGRFDARGEVYEATKPFNIKGTSYELAGLDQPGSKLKVLRSSQTVAEILPPPDLSPGNKAVPFKMTAMDGTPISFPDTYKGKIVMLDFWATWCGPCIAELPNLTAAYDKYHSRGFEVLGITLDHEKMADKVKAFTKEKNMPWQQVYDGKYWGAEVAQLYVVQSIPCAYLVDGDTGKVIASSDNVKFNDLRGDRLAPTIEKALAAKGK